MRDKVSILKTKLTVVKTIKSLTVDASKFHKELFK